MTDMAGPEPPFATCDKKEPYIFASYSHVNKAEVYSELQRLHGLGYRIWYDEGITPGEEWEAIIPGAIGGCATFVIFVSQAAQESMWINKELSFAVNRHKPILAIFLADTTLTDKWQFLIGDKQHLAKHELRPEAYAAKVEKALPGSTREKDGAVAALKVATEEGAREVNARERMNRVEPPSSDTEEATILFNQAVDLAIAGNIEGAIELYRKVLLIQPNDADTWGELGAHLDDIGDTEGAIKALRKAVTLEPKHTFAWINLGIVLQETGDVEGAIEAFREAIAVDGDYAESWYALGAALYESGDITSAIDAYRKVIAIGPVHTDAWCDLGIALDATGDYKGAIDAYRKAIEIKPDYADVWLNLSLALRKAGRVPEAAEAMARYEELKKKK
jgi:tetratricopeptide (TPR) repeat protein